MEQKIINIHPSLLPSFRGKNAVKQALENKVKTAGCSVHFVDEGIDTGEIISQEKVPVSSNDNEETLGKKILKKEHVLYIKVIKELERNVLMEKITQNLMKIFLQGLSSSLFGHVF